MRQSCGRHAPELHRYGARHICTHLTLRERDALPSFQLILDGQPPPPSSADGRLLQQGGRQLSGGGRSASDESAPRSASTTLLLRPGQYMVRYPSPRSRRDWRRGERHYCADIFSNGRSGGTVLGASVLRQREVIFDVAAETISFVDARCDEIDQGSAHMRGGWAFAPCPRHPQAGLPQHEQHPPPGVGMNATRRAGGGSGRPTSNFAPVVASR